LIKITQSYLVNSGKNLSQIFETVTINKKQSNKISKILKISMLTSPAPVHTPVQAHVPTPVQAHVPSTTPVQAPSTSTCSNTCSQHQHLFKHMFPAPAPVQTHVTTPVQAHVPSTSTCSNTCSYTSSSTCSQHQFQHQSQKRTGWREEGPRFREDWFKILTTPP